MKTKKKPKNTKPIQIRRRYLSIIIAVLGLLVFGNTLSHDFTHDDIFLIKDNSFVTQGFSGISDIFTNDYWAGALGDAKSSGLYRPMPLFVYAVLWEYFGNNAFIFHAANLFFYILSAIFLMLLITALTEGHTRMLALFAACLFLVHPLHVESVANVKGMAEVLSGLFVLSASWLFVLYLKKDKIILLLLSLVAFFLGLLSKEEAFAWLAVFFVIAGISGEKTFFANLFNRWKTLIFLTLPLIAAFGLRFAIGIGISAEISPVENPLVATGGQVYYANVSSLAFESFSQLLLPRNLVHDYSAWQIELIPSFAHWKSIAGILLTIALCGIAIIFTLKKKLSGLAMAAILLAWLPGSNLLITTEVMRADRLLFLPLAGFAFLTAILLYKASDIITKKKWRYPAYLPFILLLPLAIMSFQRNKVWESNARLFEADYKRSPNNVKLRVNYAGVLYNKGIEANNRGMDAANYFRQSKNILLPCTKLFPEYIRPWIDLGYTYEWLGQYDSAAYVFQKALILNPSDSLLAERILNIKLIIDEDFAKCKQLVAERRYKEALPYSLNVLEKYPHSYEAWYYYGGVVYNLGEIEKATEAWKNALRINPDDKRAAKLINSD